MLGVKATEGDAEAWREERSSGPHRELKPLSSVRRHSCHLHSEWDCYHWPHSNIILWRNLEQSSAQSPLHLKRGKMVFSPVGNIFSRGFKDPCQVCRMEFTYHSLLFVVVQLLSLVWLFATPWTAAHQASLSITISLSLLKIMHWVSDAIQPFHPLSPSSLLALNLSTILCHV